MAQRLCVQTCDIVTARAVAEMPTLAELCLPFVRPGGQLIVAKGATPQVSHRRQNSTPLQGVFVHSGLAGAKLSLRAWPVRCSQELD